MDKPNAQDRVLVIGAGAAGLTAARRLGAIGFRDVTVLEAASRVGGKCWTVSHAGEDYEMGAIGFPGANNTFRRLAEASNVPSSSTWTYSYVDRKGSRLLPNGISLGTPWSALRLAPKLFALQKPGYLRIAPDTAKPTSAWLAAHDLTSLGRAMQPLVTGLGYGFFREISAAYSLKHFALFRPDVYQLLRGGSQRVWEKASASLDVRLEHRVTKIDRNEDRVHVKTDRGGFEGRWLILATPPAESASFLGNGEHKNEGAHALLTRFRTFRYRALLCDISGLPNAHYGFFPDAHETLTPRQPVAYSRRTAKSRTTMLYSYEDASDPSHPPIEDVARAYQRHLEPLGARIEATHRHHTWDYFPHVGCEEMGDGFFDRFDQMQGRARTFYVGEALSFPTVRHVMEQATDIVDRFFA